MSLQCLITFLSGFQGHHCPSRKHFYLELVGNDLEELDQMVDHLELENDLTQLHDL